MLYKTWIQPVIIKRLPHLSSALILITLMLVSSCKYEPTAVNFVDIDTANVNKIILDMVKGRDTIVISGGGNKLYIGYSKKDSRGISVKAWIDGREVNSDAASEYNRDDTGHVIVDVDYPVSLPAGAHKLRIDIYANSGTGSYADKNDKEVKLFLSRTWTLVKIGKWVVPNITSVAEYKGYAKVTWEKCNPLYGVYKYMIVRSEGYYHRRLDTVAIVDDISKCEAIDSGYVGGYRHYDIYTYISNGGEPLNASYESKSVLPSNLSVKIHGREMTVRWNKTPFYNNCKGYMLFYNRNSLNKELCYINDLNDTVFKTTTDFKMGEQATLYLAYVPGWLEGEKKIEEYLPCSISKSLAEGDKSFSYKFIYAPHSDENLYYTSATNLKFYKFNTSLQKETDSAIYYYQYIISPKGRFWVRFSNGIGYMCKDGKVQNPDKFQISDLSKGDSFLQSVSDNGIALVNWDSYLAIVDFNTKNVIYKINEPGLISNQLQISTDGKYFFALGSNDAYSFDGSSIKKLWTGSKDIIYAEYMPDDPGKIVVVEPNSIQIRNSDDGAVIKSFTTSSIKRVFNIDFAKGQMLACTGNEIHVISLIDGEVVLTIAASASIALSDPYPYILKNGKIYCKSGYSFDLGE